MRPGLVHSLTVLLISMSSHLTNDEKETNSENLITTSVEHNTLELNSLFKAVPLN
jgi:hypothetical protein